MHFFISQDDEFLHESGQNESDGPYEEKEDVQKDKEGLEVVVKKEGMKVMKQQKVGGGVEEDKGEEVGEGVEEDVEEQEAVAKEKGMEVMKKQKLGEVEEVVEEVAEEVAEEEDYKQQKVLHKIKQTMKTK